MNATTESRENRLGVSLMMLLAGSLLIGFSAGLWLAPLAAWIGPVFFIRYARDHGVSRGFPLVVVALILAFVIGFGGIWTHFGGLLAVAIFGVLYGLLWSLPYLADRLAFGRLPGFLSTLVYPLAATALEFVYIRTSPLGAWGATGFTQYGDLPLMQLASVTGMIGITFLMGWFASVANWAWENRARVGEIRGGLVAFGTVLAVVYAFGLVRLNFTSLSGVDETVRVAGITVESHHSLVDRVSDDWETATSQVEVQAFRDAYFDETAREARAGAKVILWSEGAGIGPPSADASLIAQGQEVAREYGIYLAIPLFTRYPDPGQLNQNKLVVIDPTGAIVIEHVKYGGVNLEGSRAGDGVLQTATTPFGVLSGIICYDADFPAIVRQAGQNGTGLILVPSADWLEIDPVHTYMAVFRAIENGMSLVRQTDVGRSIAVDPYGRVLAQVDFFGATDRTMVAQVPVGHVDTLYTSFGRWFEWLCLIGFLLVLAWALIARRVPRT